MQYLFRPMHIVIIFIASFTCAPAFAMEEELQELQLAYFECKTSCEQQSTHHGSPLYSAALRHDSQCKKQCERTFKASFSLLKIEQSRKMNAAHSILLNNQNQ